MKQEMLNLQQAFQQEQQTKYRLEELLRLKEAYFFNEDGGVYREINPKNGHSFAYCPKCMHEKEKAVPLSIPEAEERERWICAVCEWKGWSRAADHMICFEILLTWDSQKYPNLVRRKNTTCLACMKLW